MTAAEIKAGDVVQISPDTESAFAGCFMYVTEPKSWGAQGFISCPVARGTLPGSAYYRAQWAEMEPVGKAAFVPVEA